MRQITKVAFRATFALLFMSTAHAESTCRDVAPAAAATYRSDVRFASDNTCLRSFSWQPKSDAKAIVIITHGIRDYALRYDSFAKQLTAHGYVVFAQDLRGHAHSGGDRQRFDSMQQLVGDTDLIVNAAKRQFPDLPVFMYGHSLGGLVTTKYMIAHPEKLRGVVLSGAALMRPRSVGSFSIFLARLLASLAPGVKAVAVDDSEFSRDPAVMAALAVDPLISRDKLPAISAIASVDGMQDVEARSASIKLPLLVMYGSADKVNPIAGSQALYNSVTSVDKSIRSYDGLYHDMLNEPEREQVMTDVIAWLNARL